MTPAARLPERRQPAYGQGVEVGQAGATGGRIQQQRHRYLGDHAEGALRSGDQPGQVVTRDILPEPAAGPHNLAGRQHDRRPST